MKASTISIQAGTDRGIEESVHAYNCKARLIACEARLTARM